MLATPIRDPCFYRFVPTVTFQIQESKHTVLCIYSMAMSSRMGFAETNMIIIFMSFVNIDSNSDYHART